MAAATSPTPRLLTATSQTPGLYYDNTDNGWELRMVAGELKATLVEAAQVSEDVADGFHTEQSAWELLTAAELADMDTIAAGEAADAADYRYRDAA